MGLDRPINNNTTWWWVPISILKLHSSSSKFSHRWISRSTIKWLKVLVEPNNSNTVWGSRCNNKCQCNSNKCSRCLSRCSNNRCSNSNRFSNSNNQCNNNRTTNSRWTSNIRCNSRKTNSVVALTMEWWAILMMMARCKSSNSSKCYHLSSNNRTTRDQTIWTNLWLLRTRGPWIWWMTLGSLMDSSSNNSSNRCKIKITNRTTCSKICNRTRSRMITWCFQTISMVVLCRGVRVKAKCTTWIGSIWTISSNRMPLIQKIRLACFILNPPTHRVINLILINLAGRAL